MQITSKLSLLGTLSLAHSTFFCVFHFFLFLLGKIESLGATAKKSWSIGGVESSIQYNHWLWLRQVGYSSSIIPARCLGLAWSDWSRETENRFGYNFNSIEVFWCVVVVVG